MTRTFIVEVDSPDDVVKSADVKLALVRYIQAHDEEAERYGYEIAGYSVEAKEVSHAS